MQIVIDIPDKRYALLQRVYKVAGFDKLSEWEEYIIRGTPLPKGHGRLGDLDALRCENADFDTYNDYCTMFDEIDAAPTIIEADKEA